MLDELIKLIQSGDMLSVVQFLIGPDRERTIPGDNKTFFNAAPDKLYVCERVYGALSDILKTKSYNTVCVIRDTVIVHIPANEIPETFFIKTFNEKNVFVIECLLHQISNFICLNGNREGFSLPGNIRTFLGAILTSRDDTLIKLLFDRLNESNHNFIMEILRVVIANNDENLIRLLITPLCMDSIDEKNSSVKFLFEHPQYQQNRALFNEVIGAIRKKAVANLFRDINSYQQNEVGLRYAKNELNNAKSMTLFARPKIHADGSAKEKTKAVEKIERKILEI